MASAPASDDDSAFDAYLERALAGAPPEPGEFAASASASLKNALERIYKRSRGGDELPFERIGEFRILEKLGGGGMGLVYLAEQESLGRRVALKIVRPELRGSAVAAERFHREVRAVAQLRHPSIVTVFAAGEERGVRYLAMELVEGDNLDELIKRGELATTPIATRVRWALELARALEYAHSRGVIHRDVKPSNIRITREGKALLLDFGLARTADAGATMTDGFAGSPSYASPEQIERSAELDHRTDLYSLGATLYQCVTGVVPFEGANVEQVFHRVLTGVLLPPRKREPSVPRDLETVILQALARDPRRRYASAGALADDLEAVLELRPIRGRRQSAWERMRGFARRRPALASVTVTAALALIVSVAVFVAQRRLHRDEARAEAQRTVQAARDKIAAYRKERDELRGLKYRVEEARRQQQYAYVPPSEIAWLDQNERKAEQLERAWEATFYEVLDLLRLAERLDRNVGDVESVRAELHFERLREARDARDEATAEFHRDLVLAHDQGGEWARQIAGELELTLITDPPGAEVHVFRMLELADLLEGAEPRNVALPLRGDSALDPHAWALRVVTPSEPLARGDLIVELAGRPIRDLVLVASAREPVREFDRLVSVDGAAVGDTWALEQLCAKKHASGEAKSFVFERDGARFEVAGADLEELGVVALTAVELATSSTRSTVPASVLRNGERIALTLPPGLDVRATAAPFARCAASSAGVTPLNRLALASGAYVVVASHPDFDEYVLTLGPGVGHVERRISLHPLGSAPRSFVHVDDPDGSFWICEHEVTAGEYLEFLNDSATRNELAASFTPIRIPRSSRGTAQPELFWGRDSRGVFSLPDDWRADWPVLGITWDDALAYARWRSERDGAREYAIATYFEYVRAGIGRLPWRYTWGSRFRAYWSHTCFARPSAQPGRVMQFPVDQSVFGVFDLCGGAFEWLDAWYDAGRNLRHIGGGAWGHSEPGVIAVAAGYGAEPESSSGSIGFRLVVRERR